MAPRPFGLLLAFLMVFTSARCEASPATVQSGGTIYLKDADRYLGKAPLLPKISSTPTPTPTATPRPSATATATPRELTDSNDEGAKPRRKYPPAIIHRSSMNVGQQIPVPTRYAAPQVIASQNGGVTVVPATPTTFQTIQTGVTTGTDGSGNTTVRDTELSGVVNYGRPIQTVAPVYNQNGQPVGTQVITTPNPIVVPVTQTIEISR